MRYLDVGLAFYQCIELDPLNFKSIAKIVFDHGFIFEQYMGDYMRRIEKRDEVDGLVEKHYHVGEIDAKTGLPLKWDLRFLAYPQVMKDSRNSSFEALQFNARTNRVVIAGLLDFEFSDERHLTEPYAQSLARVATALYPIIRPAIGWVDNTDRNTTDKRDARKLRLRVISWINLWGPEYVQQHGEDFLLGMPGHKTESLPDGGVFHQLTPNFVTEDRKGVKRLREQVVAYCAGKGLNVKCHAPYTLPAKIPFEAATEEKMSDAEVKAYLAQILATSLVLDDGTRVKPVYINWSDLTSDQRQSALQAIKQTAIAESKQLKDKGRLRFEFNEIPDELNEMLRDLVGDDHGDVEWLQVDMGENQEQS